MKLLLLVPGFGRSENGLFHYSRVLEKELLKKNMVSFYDPCEADNADAIYLNYSGYGYQKRGLPIDLFLKLRSLVKGKKIPLFIYFHELYAGGNRWNQSSFWLYPLQKKLCHLFLDLSTASFCGNEAMFELLRTGRPQAAHKLNYAGLFSNIPVPEKNNQHQRERVAVVFGSPGKRAELFSNLPLIEQVCDKLRITRIIDIGSGAVPGYRNLKSISVDVKGALAPEEVAVILQSSQYGFLSYVEHLFGKSGIFAAYAGNGMTIVNFPPESQSPKDGLVRGVHYLNAPQVLEGSFEGLDFSDAAFSWYQPRRVANHSKIIYEVIRKEFHQ
jgi:hypothetical protein